MCTPASLRTHALHHVYTPSVGGVGGPRADDPMHTHVPIHAYTTPTPAPRYRRGAPKKYVPFPNGANRYVPYSHSNASPSGATISRSSSSE